MALNRSGPQTSKAPRSYGKGQQLTAAHLNQVLNALYQVIVAGAGIKIQRVGGKSVISTSGSGVGGVANGTLIGNIPNVGDTADIRDVSTANSAGSSGRYADAAHKHKLATYGETSAMSSVGDSSSNSAGNSLEIARINHRHEFWKEATTKAGLPSAPTGTFGRVTAGEKEGWIYVRTAAGAWECITNYEANP